MPWMLALNTYHPRSCLPDATGGCSLLLRKCVATDQTNSHMSGNPKFLVTRMQLVYDEWWFNLERVFLRTSRGIGESLMAHFLCLSYLSCWLYPHCYATQSLRCTPHDRSVRVCYRVVMGFSVGRWEPSITLLQNSFFLVCMGSGLEVIILLNLNLPVASKRYNPWTD